MASNNLTRAIGTPTTTIEKRVTVEFSGPRHVVWTASALTTYSTAEIRAISEGRASPWQAKGR